jgi:hypothetical protein
VVSEHLWKNYGVPFKNCEGIFRLNKHRATLQLLGLGIRETPELRLNENAELF